MNVVEIARLFLFVREAQEQGQNRGLRVEAIQKWGGGLPGDSWCAWWATMVLDLFFKGQSPVPRMGSCEAIHQLAQTNGWVTETPSEGDLALAINSAGIAHHIGIVTQSDPLVTIAGNTSADGSSANGDRVAEHPVSRETYTFVAYPRDLT